jgi:hypothetical protein
VRVCVSHRLRTPIVNRPFTQFSTIKGNLLVLLVSSTDRFYCFVISTENFLIGEDIMCQVEVSGNIKVSLSVPGGLNSYVLVASIQQKI